MENGEIIQWIGAGAGIIVFFWKMFEAFAAKSSGTWDDKIVNTVNNVLLPLISAVEENTKATQASVQATAENTGATAAASAATVAAVVKP